MDIMTANAAREITTASLNEKWNNMLSSIRTSITTNAERGLYSCSCVIGNVTYQDMIFDYLTKRGYHVSFTNVRYPQRYPAEARTIVISWE